jgi:pyruvate/2-oxoglutarate dehydrogenase complex dihydrolipoamide acyltransferase (E2) component
VRAGEAIAEVMTQKVNLEVESPADGVLHAQLAEPDQTVTPGAVIGTVRTP